MRTYLFVFLGVLLFGEFFSYRGFKLLTADRNPVFQAIVKTIYWVWTVTVLALTLYASFNRSNFSPAGKANVAFVIVGLFLMNFSFKTLFGTFHFFNEVLHGVGQLFAKKPVADVPDDTISRANFLTLTGLAVAGIPFSGLLYGMVYGRYDITVFKRKIIFGNLPRAFDGVKIVQISDLHLGSFSKKSTALRKAVERVNALEPDYIFFTGDMVNEIAEEAAQWIETLKQLKAKKGMFSILGNHDYGDYAYGLDKTAKQTNLKKLKVIQKEMGFNLLLNEGVLLTREEDRIRLIGVENWGRGRFSKYGDFQKASKNSNDDEFQILLSHDPSHFEEKIKVKTAVDLTLSGHTHGFQFGIDIRGLKWSPAQYRYDKWAGLYKEGAQYLYVNRGFGYVGYAGRVGMPPEITEITLYRG